MQFRFRRCTSLSCLFSLLPFGEASQFCSDPHDIHIFENCKPILVEHLSVWVCLMLPHIEVQVFRLLQEHQRSDDAF